MKRFLLPLSLLCITLISSSARMNADTISITQAVISINLNFGAGDNVSSSMTGPGTQISGGGGAGCIFVLPTPSYFPAHPSVRPSTSLRLCNLSLQFR
jgi:hypothetical protein